MDLFQYADTYPKRAGYKEANTSKEAAQAVEATGRAARLRDDVLAYFQAGRQATADEVAEALEESVLSIRPRVAELKAAGLIVETGVRRRSSTSRSSHVWRVV